MSLHERTPPPFVFTPCAQMMAVVQMFWAKCYMENKLMRHIGAACRVWGNQVFESDITKMAEVDGHASHSWPSSEPDNAFNKCLMCQSPSPIQCLLREATFSLCLLRNCRNVANSAHDKYSFWFCEYSWSGWILSRLPEDCQCLTSVSGSRYADYKASMKGLCVINTSLTHYSY